MKKISKNVNKILGKAGFTLVELLVVMAILGILIAVAIAGIGIAQRGARDNTRIRDLTSIKGVLEDYYGSNKKYPASITIASGGILTIGLTTLTLQQGGDSQTTVGAPTTATFATSSAPGTITSCVNRADAGSWTFAYSVNSATSASAYKLCTTLENGTIYDLSSDK